MGCWEVWSVVCKTVSVGWCETVMRGMWYVLCILCEMCVCVCVCIIEDICIHDIIVMRCG